MLAFFPNREIRGIIPHSRSQKMTYLATELSRCQN